ncbi:MAG TPA: dienelactone hydrolase family protein [Candidatus Baltobacteraceae bacterium]|jgi:carboxymethylenebutenolidase|nr:dienelactone hydrolase family protein [Candidatus Baltobacteraceae bacterium]
MITQDVQISAGTSTIAAHLARPEESTGKHPAVIVLPEVFGMTHETERVADLVASLGYVGIAVDYYHRFASNLCFPYSQEGSEEAFAAASRLKQTDILDDVHTAMDWLNGQPFVERGRIASWGFGFGGTAAIIAASIPEITGAIAFYPDGVLEPLPNGKPFITDLSNIVAPLLIVFGELDYYVPRYEMDRIYTTLTAAGKDVRMHIYPRVGHSFFRHGRPQAIAELRRYSDQAVAQAVADSWNLAKVFLSDVFSRTALSASSARR